MTRIRFTKEVGHLRHAAGIELVMSQHGQRIGQNDIDVVARAIR